jgi:hypothetical protein
MTPSHLDPIKTLVYKVASKELQLNPKIPRILHPEVEITRWLALEVTYKNKVDRSYKACPKIIKEYIYHRCHSLQQNRITKDKEMVAILMAKL